MFIDTHAHLDVEQYNLDREQVIENAKKNGVGFIINPSFDLQSAKRAGELARKYENIFAAAGCHPKSQEESGYIFNKNDFLEVARQPKVVAIGECGLELKNSGDLVNQREIFEQQIDLAKELNLPLIIHCRDAHQEVSKILAEAGDVRGVIHCFSGSWQSAQRYLEMGFYLSFNGIITYANDYDKVIKNMPLERLLLETDCPYLSPVPFRGQRNEPANVKYVAQRVAEIRTEPLENIAQITTENAKKLFQV